MKPIHKPLSSLSEEEYLTLIREQKDLTDDELRAMDPNSIACLHCAISVFLHNWIEGAPEVRANAILLIEGLVETIVDILEDADDPKQRIAAIGGTLKFLAKKLNDLHPGSASVDFITDEKEDTKH